MTDDSYLVAEIEDRLTRIAVALEVLAADVTARQARERAVLVAQRQHLTDAYARAVADYEAAEAALARASCGRLPSASTAVASQRANQSEETMVAVGVALETFEAAHPDLIDDTRGGPS